MPLNTVMILSRGQRVGPLFSEIGRALSRDCRVVGVIEESERALWQSMPGAEIMTLAEATQLAGKAARDTSLERVSAIEKETGLSLYQAARNYLLYGRMHSEIFGWQKRPWRWQSEAEIVEEYVHAYAALRHLFDTYAPDIVLLEAPDHIYAALAQVMAYQRGKLLLGIYFAPLAGDCSMFLYTGFQPINVLMRYYYEHPDAIPADARARALEMIANVRDRGPPQISYVAQMRERSRRSVGPMLRKAGAAVVSRQQWSRLAPTAVARRLGILRKELWLRRHLRHDIPDARFVLFFMQHQPEASLTTQVPHQIDQMQVIEQLAVNAPAGWRIVVKEHPRTYPARGEAYFRPLCDLPNVHLCHPAVPSRALLEKAEVVVAMTGSVGMEALFMGKKVAVVGRPYYAFFPGIGRLDRPGDLFDLLADPEGMKVEPQALEQFAAAYYASVFEAGALSPDGMWPIPEQGGANIAEALRRHLVLIAQGRLRPTDYPPFQR